MNIVPVPLGAGETLAEPIPMSIALNQLRLDLDEGRHPDEPWIEMTITAMREYAEEWLGICLISRDFKWTFDQFEAELTIPTHPATSVSEVAYVDDLGAPIVVTATDYRARLVKDSKYRDPLLKVTSVNGWPTNVSADPDSVSVTFKAGHCPAPVKSGMLLLLDELYENRDVANEGNFGGFDFGTLPRPVEALWRRYRILKGMA